MKHKHATGRLAVAMVVPCTLSAVLSTGLFARHRRQRPGGRRARRRRKGGDVRHGGCRDSQVGGL